MRVREKEGKNRESVRASEEKKREKDREGGRERDR